MLFFFRLLKDALTMLEAQKFQVLVFSTLENSRTRCKQIKISRGTRFLGLKAKAHTQRGARPSLYVLSRPGRG